MTTTVHICRLGKPVLSIVAYEREGDTCTMDPHPELPIEGNFFAAFENSEANGVLEWHNEREEECRGSLEEFQAYAMTELERIGNAL